MRVQNRSGAMSGSQAMQQRFRTALGLPFHDRLTLVIDHDEIVWAEVPLVLAARGDDQPQRVAFNDDTVVAGGP
jgi:hypothetical protein